MKKVHETSRHWGLETEYLCQCVSDRLIELVYAPSMDLVVVILTKLLIKEVFEQHWHSLSVMDKSTCFSNP